VRARQRRFPGTPEVLSRILDISLTLFPADLNDLKNFVSHPHHLEMKASRSCGPKYIDDNPAFGLTLWNNQRILDDVLTAGARAFGRLPALSKLDDMTSMSIFQWSRGRQTCWLFAVALSATAWLAEVQASTPTFPRPEVPRPAPVLFKELPAVFSKPAPSSMTDLRVIQDHVEALVARVTPAVVAVEIGNSSGSGVLISSDGLVLTAGHVGEKAGTKVTFKFPNGKTARGKTLGVDADADTGLMRITDPGPWPYVNVGEMNHTRLGDWALALGHPGGFDPKRSLVARLGRIIRQVPGQLQTDCTIFPGDSGGPLFDMYGRVIGINTSISSSTVENYHVPITAFFATWNELVGPPPAYCGLSVVDDVEGCHVSKIEKNSPASKVDLKVGDHVVKVDGRLIMLSASFERWITESAPGETLQLEIKRDNNTNTLSRTIKLQVQPPSTK
jgi:serine protease Do